MESEPGVNLRVWGRFLEEAGVTWSREGVSPKGEESVLEHLGPEPWPGTVGQWRRKCLGASGPRAMAWHSRTNSQGRESREQAVEVLVGPVPPPLLSPGFSDLQRHLKCQNRPQRPQIHPPGLSRPRALRGCSQQALRWGAWSGPPSRTALGRRRVWTTPMRSPGSLPRLEASPGQARGREGWGQVGSGGGGVAGHWCGRLSSV